MDDERMTPFLEAAIAEMLPNAGAGDACAECWFPWTAGGDEVLGHVQRASDRFAELLTGRDATRTPGPRVWSPSAYVWHVADVVRAWSERLHSLGIDGESRWAGFDPDELSRARRYGELPQVTGPWAVACSTDALTRTLEHLELDDAFVHPEWGDGTVLDGLRWVAHEIVHHELDVREGLGLATSAGSSR
jgi:hypothetical protein